jgi:ribosomal protein S18 acetylase RimI-like enzyme
MTPRIEAARPDGAEARALIDELEAQLVSHGYPQQSRHGYSVEKLLRESVAFFLTRYDGLAVGCGGVQLYGAEYAELKRMYVQPAFRGMGLGRAMLEHLAEFARAHGAVALRLETGIHQEEAIGLYKSFGFRRRTPFGEYREDPFSLHFEKALV